MSKLEYVIASKRYAEAVVAGDIMTCKWVQRACQRQLNDLAKFKGKASPYQFNPKLTDKDGREFHPADNLCAFIERLPHVKGPLAGETIKPPKKDVPTSLASIATRRLVPKLGALNLFTGTMRTNCSPQPFWLHLPGSFLTRQTGELSTKAKPTLDGLRC